MLYNHHQYSFIDEDDDDDGGGDGDGDDDKLLLSNWGGLTVSYDE